MSRRHVWVTLYLLFAFASTGCEEDIETDYGQRFGREGGASVNGTAVLARLFEAAGHHVTTATRLSPRLYENADCMVWAPDDFRPPQDDVRQWYTAWWRQGGDRTLIYIGRDYDAAPAYWNAVKGTAPPDEQAEISRRLANDQNRFLTARAAMPKDEDCQWFVARGKRRPRTVKTLEGPADWVSDVNAGQLQIELNGRLLPPPDAEVLLESKGDAIVSRQQMPGDGQLLVAVNGSFLLNFPLVHHEHRKLAARLVEEIGAPPREVVFLESRAGGPPVWEQEPSMRSRTGLDVLAVWPVSVIFLQLGALGLIFCYSRLPIFGRPRPLAAAGLADFGRHIAALASLLERTRDAKYASQRVAHYQQAARREPGRYHRGGAAASTGPLDANPTSPSPSV